MKFTKVFVTTYMIFAATVAIASIHLATMTPLLVTIDTPHGYQWLQKRTCTVPVEYQYEYLGELTPDDPECSFSFSPMRRLPGLELVHVDALKVSSGRACLAPERSLSKASLVVPVMATVISDGGIQGHAMCELLGPWNQLWGNYSFVNY